MLKTVATFLNPIQAHVVRGRLECEDIIAFVSHEHHIWAQWSLSYALGGVKVQVASANYDDAMSVISEINSGSYRILLEEEGQVDHDVRCKKCNSSSVSSLTGC